MTQKLSDDWKSLAKGNAAGCERVPQIMDADVREIGEFPDTSPRLLNIRKILSFDVTKNYKWIASCVRD